jgi:hypothetical protein
MIKVLVRKNFQITRVKVDYIYIKNMMHEV